MLLRAMCWQTILQHKIPWLRAFFVMNIGYLLNTLFPFRLGELGRAAVLSRKAGLGFFRMFSSVMVERAFDLAIAATMLLGTLPMVFEMAWARSMAISILVVVAAGLVGLFFMARNQQKLHEFALRIGRRSRFFTGWLLPKFEAILDGFAILADFRLFVLALALMVGSWSLAILQDYMILRGLVPETALWWVIFSLSASALGAGVPSVAGAIGVFEAAMIYTLGLVGVNAAQALAYALIIHGLQLGFSSAFGVIGLMREGSSLNGLLHELTVRRKVEG
jgi:hypothetical protein